MKKSILAVAVVLGSTSLFAQDLTSKKGESFLPEAEDWAISIDATPFLNYFGNFIGGNGLNTAPTWNFLTANQTITGKYFVDANTAYRASVRLGFGGNGEKVMVTDRSVNPLPSTWPTNAAEVENTAKYGMTNIGIGVGIEKRRGFGRLQGFYGAELGFNINSMKNKYTYGNALTASTSAIDVNVAPADDFTGGNGGTSLTAGTDGQGNPTTGRITEWKSGLGFGIGVRGFIGAEYFVLPRLAVGGEFGWGLVFSSQGASTTTYEVEGLANGATVEQITERTMEGNKSSSFGVDTDNVNSVFGPAGSLRITFHF
ncbi:MAG: hypothetical protein COA33_003595 [Fluviicola sp.]|nr:hypothetical protein [Fluviicola sp.]